jgi:hypothetical protein
MTFRRLTWVFPAAYLAHLAEEAPGFTSWVQRNTSERYTQRDFVTINGLGFLSTVAATCAVNRGERRALDLAYYTLVITQQAVFNAVFHAAATLAYREYSPGLVTSVLQLPLWRRLTSAALAERRLGPRDVVACTAVAGLVHAAVVARQVFFLGVPQSS